MPVRLVHDQGAGWHLELGPYSLDRDDIERLREAIASYDAATRPQHKGRRIRANAALDIRASAWPGKAIASGSVLA